MSELRVRSAHQRDCDAIYEICLRTCDAGGDGSHLHDDPLLPGHVWAGAYPELEPDHAYVLVGEDDVPLGYAFGALDTTAFEARLERDWWPRLRERYPLGSDGAPDARTEADRAMVLLIHEPPIADPTVTAAFPSHLHIDLLPVAQGRGAGRMLIDTVIDSLSRASSTGVHLGVDIRNDGAIGFYRAIGFSEVRRLPGGLIMALSIAGHEHSERS